MIKHDYKLDYNGERGEKSESIISECSLIGVNSSTWNKISYTLTNPM